MITLTVEGIDRSSFVNWRSLKVQQAITSQPDKCNFSVAFNGDTKNWAPMPGDEVVIYDDAVGVFGGFIARVDEGVTARELLSYDVECVSWEKDLDRYLVIDTYEDVSALYIVNSIFSDYVNRDHIVLFSGVETFTDEVGTSSADLVRKVYSTQGRTFTVPAATTDRGRRQFSSPRNLDVYDNGRAGTSQDFLVGWAFVTGGVDTARARLGNETGGTYTNYLEQTFSGLVPGWNYCKVRMADMTQTGTFDRTAVDVLQLAGISSAAGGDIVFSDWRIINSDAYTLGNVKNADAIVNYAKFNYDLVSQAIRQIAEVVGNDWYVAPDKDVHFFAPSTETAPFFLTDINGNYVFGSLSLEEDSANLRNEIFVRGGNELGNTQSEDLSYQIDGTNMIFQMGYGYNGLAVTLNGSPQTIGIDNVTEPPTSVDVLYNFQEKSMRFSTVTPSPGDSLIVSGKPYIPVIIKKRDAGSIAEHGVHQFLIVDKTINSRQAARDRAQAELNTYRDNLSSGGFKTYQSGLRAGQTIQITSAIRALDEQYIISRLSLTMQTPTDPVYTATIVSSRTYGIIEFLIDLLRKDLKQITIGGDEVVDVIESYEEEINIGEVVVTDAPYIQPETITMTEAEADYIDSQPIFVAGPYHPTSLMGDRKRPAFADRGNTIRF